MAAAARDHSFILAASPGMALFNACWHSRQLSLAFLGRRRDLRTHTDAGQRRNHHPRSIPRILFSARLTKSKELDNKKLDDALAVSANAAEEARLKLVAALS